MNNVNAEMVFNGSLLSLTDVFCNTEGAGLGSASDSSTGRLCTWGCSLPHGLGILQYEQFKNLNSS